MTIEFVIEIVRNALITGMLVGGPLLLIALVVGVLVALFQAVTQINEATLTFIPKIIAVSLTLLLLFPWFLKKLSWFMEYIFSNFPNFIH